MHSLVNTNFSRTYNPSGKQNALSDIKRLLSSRDTVAQNKACGYLIEVINRYHVNSAERIRMAEYLLENDITVFLCEATSNLDLSLFRSILSCFRLLWRQHRFFSEEHAAYSMAAVLRALAHYANSGSHGAVECCLHFLCDLLAGISTTETTACLSQQSAYSADQLLACLINLAPRIVNRRNSILSSALVLHAMISYQPAGLRIRGNISSVLVEVLGQWFRLLIGALNHSALTGDGDDVSGTFYAITCQLGIAALRLIKLLREDKQTGDFIQRILVDEEELNTLTQSATEMMKAVHSIITDLVTFTKENQHQLPTEEYGAFLKFLLCFLSDQIMKDSSDFCDMLATNGYLKMLPHIQITRKVFLRKDMAVRKISTLVLGEILKVLAQKHLGVDNETEFADERCAKDIHMGLMELQNGIERPHTLGLQLKQCQPYSLLIYIYFSCQSSDNPQEATAPLLPYLIEHILRLPKTFKPPKYIIKALWLVFAMSTISNCSLRSLDERVDLERATGRLLGMLLPEPSVYYTHNPAILLWAFTSARITNAFRVKVLSQWLQTEDALPTELASQSIVWDLLLNVLIESQNKIVLYNAVKTLNLCIEEGDEETRQDFSSHLWSLLPGVLSKVLIDYDCETETNLCYLLELATNMIPLKVQQMLCAKVAVLLATIFSKTISERGSKDRCHFEYVCLKLSLFLLEFSCHQNDSKDIVLATYIQRAGFLPSVLLATSSGDDRVACAALRLLSYIVHYFTKSNYQAKAILEVETRSILKSLRQDSSNERGASLLQLVYMILNSNCNTPLVLSNRLEEVPSATQQYAALRALMFRVQMMCCKESTPQSSACLKTLSAIFNHAVLFKNDTNLIAKLTTQPWTHTLVHFQLTQKITPEFLTFVDSWLKFLKMNQKPERMYQINIFKQSLICKTVVLLRKNLVLDNDDELIDLKRKVLMKAQETFDVSGQNTQSLSDSQVV